MSSEQGYTLPELLIGMSMAMIVILAAFGLMQVANRSSADTAARVDANQQARPVMQRIMDELRSTCVRRDIDPVLPESTAGSIAFLHETGSDVAPVPDKRTITYDSSAGTLTENAYPASPTTQGSDGTWTFSPTPISGAARMLLPDVQQATLSGSTVPVFQYYSYNNGTLTQITPSGPAGTGGAPTLDTAAPDVVQVVVSFLALPPNNPTASANVGVSITDTALLRFGPASESATTLNAPCT